MTQLRLSDAIERYLADCKAQDYAPSTVRHRSHALRALMADIGNIYVHHIEPHHLSVYWEKHSHWGPGTANDKRAQLSSFFSWCRTHKVMPLEHNPLAGTRKRSVEDRPKLIVRPEDWAALLDAAEARDPRDRIVVAIGLYLSIRASEIVLIRWRDVNFDDVHRGTPQWEPTVDIFRPKTGKGDRLPMTLELYEELRRWRLKLGELTGQVVRGHWYVAPKMQPPRFIASGTMAPRALLPEQGIQPITVGRIIKGSLRDMGFSEEELKGQAAHVTRRSGGSALYHKLSEVGHDRAMRITQSVYGHRNLHTTEAYLQLDLESKDRNDSLAGKSLLGDVGRGGSVVEVDFRQNEGSSDG